MLSIPGNKIIKLPVTSTQKKKKKKNVEASILRILQKSSRLLQFNYGETDG